MDVTYVYKETEHSIPNDGPQVDKPVLEVTRYMTDKGIELQDAKRAHNLLIKPFKTNGIMTIRNLNKTVSQRMWTQRLCKSNTVSTYYVFDDTDENTNLFLAGQFTKW